MNPADKKYTINNTPYFTPIVITQDRISQKCFVKALVAIGSMADRYVSFGKYEFHATSKEMIAIKAPILKTLLKIASFALTGFILPLLALAAKDIYRKWAIAQYPIKPSTPLPLPPVIDRSVQPEAIYDVSSENESNSTLNISHDELRFDDTDLDLAAAALNNLAPAQPEVEEPVVIDNDQLQALIDLSQSPNVKPKDKLKLNAFIRQIEVNNYILKDLEEIEFSDLSDEEVMKKLFKLENLLHYGKKFDSVNAATAQDILSEKNVPTFEAVASQLQPGQILIPINDERKPIPAKFAVTITEFIKKMKEKIFFKNRSGLEKFMELVGVSSEDKQPIRVRVLSMMIHKVPVGRKGVHARTESNTLYQVGGLRLFKDTVGFAAVSKGEFDQKKPNPLAEDSAWDSSEENSGSTSESADSAAGTMMIGGVVQSPEESEDDSSGGSIIIVAQQ